MEAGIHRIEGKLPYMYLTRTFAAVAALSLLCACAEAEQGTWVNDAAVVASPNPWPAPRIAPGDAPPQILTLWMNETTIPSGSDWVGRAITTTNVASLEIRTESFSFVADRVGYGDFRFSQHVLDMVPYYKRPYTLDVIARNAAGVSDERLVRISFR
ncbi:MAG TPA: hypothetical protein VMH02_09405 [Verrucomicrobiae bacterium]|nr:hypothetical protein [Verrucomicrobiae bacterium]